MANKKNLLLDIILEDGTILYFVKNRRIKKKMTKTAIEKELKALKKECLRLWKAVVKFRAGHKCEFPGCKKKGYLCAHHIESYSVNKTLRYIVENGVAFCLTHHKFGRISAHKSFIMMHLFMLEHKRSNLEFLIEHHKDKEDLSKEYLIKQIAFLSSLLPEKKAKKSQLPSLKRRACSVTSKSN